ncbi:MAG: acetyl-CoA carboxylase biotin carboxyl carrier protein [Candidatus Nealsonbacteria bacterium]|nr:acetyl-CoA carboxylase biotin carboxyl carrier protein [Candidatus Nealsonbacteria bacterium]
MAGSSSEQDIFDVEKINRLVELMEDHDLKEIDLRQGETRVRLRRGADPAELIAAAVPRAEVPPPLPAPVPVAPAPQADDEHFAVVISPMVGTFYATSDPDSPPYVKVGDHVGPETTVCIVEAMKVFNQIPAEVSGKIVAVLVENGEPVEYGQPIFKVDTRD